MSKHEFKRMVALGYVELPDQPERNNAVALIPVFYYKDGKVYPVIANLTGDKDKPFNGINLWATRINTTPIIITDLNSIPGYPYRKLLASTYINFPDMATRSEKFKKGDPSQLSEPGLFVPAAISPIKEFK